MDTNTLTIIGIVTAPIPTALVFLLTYRSTVGARKERAKHARKEIVSDLVGLLSQDPVDLTRDSVEALLRSKSKAYDIGELTMADFPSMMDDVIARFTEADLVSARKRTTLMASAQAFKKRIETEIRPTAEGERIVKESSQFPYKWGIALTASASTFVSLWLMTTYGVYAATNTSNWKTPTIVTGITVLAMVLSLSGLALLWSRSERDKKRAAGIAYVGKAFEEMVRRVLRANLRERMQEDFTITGKNGVLSRFDAVLVLSSQPLPVEIRYGAPDSDQVSRMLQNMKEAGFKKALLITSSQLHKPVKALARANGIELFEAVTSEEDLARRLTTLQQK